MDRINLAPTTPEEREVLDKWIAKQHIHTAWGEIHDSLTHTIEELGEDDHGLMSLAQEIIYSEMFPDPKDKPVEERIINLLFERYNLKELLPILLKNEDLDDYFEGEVVTDEDGDEEIRIKLIPS